MIQLRSEVGHCKARLVLNEADKPIQMVLTARQAADLAFIASDFAKQVVPTTPEVERLTNYAAMIASKLEDLVAAREMMGLETPEAVHAPQPDLAKAG